MKKKITFNDVPEAINNLSEEVNQIKKLLNQKNHNSNNVEEEKWLDLETLVDYDPQRRTKATWYAKISKGEVPFYKNGKKLYFLKSEIDEWLRKGKVKTISEIKKEADKYLSNTKKGLNNGN